MSLSRDTDVKDLLKDKRVLFGGGGAIVLILALAIYFFFIKNDNAPDAATLPGPGVAPKLPGMGASPGTQVAQGPGGTTAVPPGGVAPGTAASGAPGVGGPGATTGLPGRPGMPLGGKKPGAGGGALSSLAVPQDSFAGAPIGYGGAATGIGGIGAPGGLGGGIGGGDPGIMPGGGLPGGSAPTSSASTSSKPQPIEPNRKAVAARIDPFVPFYKFIIMQPPAYTLLAEMRLATRPTPTPIPPDKNPDLRFGPLPYVERRVAGILFDGSVSAIMETGTPGGANTEVDVIQPGSTVPSGAPNIEPLTVASITPTQVVLRAQDGRTTIVKLSNVSAEFSDAFHSAATGPGGGGSGDIGGPGPGGAPGGRGGRGVPGGNLGTGPRGI